MTCRISLCLLIASGLTCLLAAGEKGPGPLNGVRDPGPLSPPAQIDLSKDSCLYVVAVSHLDTQWRWTIQDTIRGYIPATLRYNFRAFEQFPHYVLGWEGAFRYMLAKEYYPRDYAKLREYVAAGRWHPAGATLDSCDAVILSPESLLRQILYGNAFFRREFGRPCIDLLLTDSFGYSAALPSIMAHAGLRGFVTQKLTWGCAAGIPFDIGRWEGVDGASVLAVLNPGSYMADPDGDLGASPLWRERIDSLGRSSGVFAGYLFFGVGDRGGAPLAASLESLEKSIAAAGPIRVISAPPDRLFRDLTDDQADRLPRYRGELLLTTHGTGCYTSQAAMKRWNRRNELLADAAERAAVAADWIGGAPYPRAHLAEAWLRFLVHQFHDDLPGTCIPRAYVFSWNDEVIAMNMFSDVLADAAGAVARGLDTRSEGAAVVVYNPLSVRREDVVEAVVRLPGGAPRAVRVFDPDGDETPSQLAGTEGDAVRIIFLAEVPPVGFAVFDVRPADEPCAIPTGLRVTESEIENNRYLVRVNAAGDVESIRDKDADRELLASPLRLELLNDLSPAWPAWEIWFDDIIARPRRTVGGPATVRVVERGPARVALEISREAEGSRFVQRLRLASGGSEARVEFDTAIDWRTMGTLLKAALRLAVSNSVATYDLGLGTIDRPTNTPRLYEVLGHQWADVTDADGNYGVAILNDSKYGWDRPDERTIRLTLLHTPETGDRAYTDQATQDLGRHRFTYAVCGHKGDWRTAAPWEAARLNQPLIAFQAPSHAGALGRTFSLVDLDTPQVAVRAIKKAESGDEVIVRLQELEGRFADNVRISFASGIMAAREVNGSEAPVGPATIEDGDIVADFQPYRLRTFAVRLAAPPARLRPPVSKPIRLPFNLDVTSMDEEKDGGDFDGASHSLPAELMPATVTSQSVQFQFGPTAAPAEKNALSCAGQTIALPRGNFSRLYLLAASTGGDAKATFLVDGRPTELAVQEFSGLVGQWDSRVVDGKIVDPDRIVPGFIKRDPVAWLGTHRHTADGKNEPYVFCYLFRYRIDLAKGARWLVLPKDENLRILAATVASDTNDDTRPAQLLYD